MSAPPAPRSTRSPSLLEPHRRANLENRRAYERYAQHRARLMRLIPRPRPKGERLLVLGAGNCNDLDLAELCRSYAELHLVDVDRGAVEAALGRADRAVRAVAHVHELDLSGVFDRLSSFREDPPTLEELRALPDRLSRDLRARLAVARTVVSAGLLSQIVMTVKETLGDAHPAWQAVALAASAAHVCGALDLTAPGGTLVLAIDPSGGPSRELERVAAQLGPQGLLQALETRGRCLPGTESDVVLAALSSHRPEVQLELIPAWLWPVSTKRTHVVYGVVASPV